jgi:hypothetical protein
MDSLFVDTDRIRTHCFVHGPPDGIRVLPARQPDHRTVLAGRVRRFP